MLLGKVLIKRIHLERCSSTNSVLKGLINSNQSIVQDNDGVFITTGYQIHGRGTEKNSWHSTPEKNILMSFLAYPDKISPAEQFDISRLISLSIVDFLKSSLPDNIDIKIKWPNDIFAAGKKVAGILIENSIIENSIVNSIIGIGINVNEVSFPKGIPLGTSMKLLTSTDYDLERTIKDLILFIYDRNRSSSFSKEGLRKEYDRHLLGLGVLKSFEHEGRIFQGIIRGTDKTGMIEIETKEKIYSFGFKEVVFKS